MNTLIFQTNYHTSAFNSFDGGTATEKGTLGLPQKMREL